MEVFVGLTILYWSFWGRWIYVIGDPFRDLTTRMRAQRYVMSRMLRVIAILANTTIILSPSYQNDTKQFRVITINSKTKILSNKKKENKLKEKMIIRTFSNSLNSSSYRNSYVLTAYETHASKMCGFSKGIRAIEWKQSGSYLSSLKCRLYWLASACK